MEQKQLTEKKPKETEKVPIFGSWKGWYIFTVCFLLALIVFFFTLTTIFND